MNLISDKDSHAGSSNVSMCSSTNSRAHMCKVSQINFIKKQKGNITNHYEIKNVLGEGSYGKVCRCVSKISNMERAVKYIKKKSIDDPKGIQRF